jgi:hypothetical protein
LIIRFSCSNLSSKNFLEIYFIHFILLIFSKYMDALEVVISNRKCERKVDYVNDILNKAPELQYKVDELCVKYKVQL